jgi:hypothetical protein
LKNWEFGKEVARVFCPARGAVFIDTLQVQDEKPGAKPTPPKTNFSSDLCIYTKLK